ncbi:MAG: dipeptide ABC transporter ATP-binding protein, partial [Planctomycetales bacterium]
QANTELNRSPGTAPLLEVHDLEVHFPIRRGLLGRVSGHIRAVDGVSFNLGEGETLGLVGESGCGKSTLARAVLNLVPPTSGEVHFEGQRIDGLGESQMRPYRRQLQMIFQDPFASLNPRMTVGQIVGEPMQIFNLFSKQDRKLEVMRLLDMVGLNPRFLNRYPHEFSGGQRQRIGIARALAVNPKLILCDEPVSALDVSIQAQVINLLMDLQQKLGLSYLFIAHDLAVVRHIADRVGVMYLGRLVEVAEVETLYADPRHPYTKALLSSVPVADPEMERKRQHMTLSGEVPSPDRVYPGCPFADRCPIGDSHCLQAAPPLEGDDRLVACYYAWDESQFSNDP